MPAAVTNPNTALSNAIVNAQKAAVGLVQTGNQTLTSLVSDSGAFSSYIAIKFVRRDLVSLALVCRVCETLVADDGLRIFRVERVEG